MALNFSSYSVYPIPVRSVDEDFGSSSRHWGFDSGCSGSPYWADWDAGGWYDYGGEADIDSSYDPAELLPADPFGMELSTTLSAALAGWMIDFRAAASDYEAPDDDLVAGLSYYWHRTLKSEPCLSSLSAYNPWMELGLPGLSFYNSQNMQELQNSCVAEAACSGRGSAPHELQVLGLSFYNSQNTQELQNSCVAEAACSGGGGSAPHELRVPGLSFYNSQDMQEFQSSHVAEAACSRGGSAPHELQVLGLSFYNSQNMQELQNSCVAEATCSEGGSAPHELRVPELSFYNSQDMQELQSSHVAEAACSGGGSAPHEGLFYALGYLGIRDILSVEMVCRSLRSAVQNDTLLWRCIHIDSPLSEKITDGDLFRLTQRAQGSLYCLSLVGCPKITDEGLKRMLETNPRLKKLGVPGCVRLSIEGLINNLKAFKSAGRQGVDHLKLGRLFSISPEQYEDLKALVGGDDNQEPRKPQFYHECHLSPLACDDQRAIDIELCPLCEKFKLVYDCPSESCQMKESDNCRGCDLCIARCIQCGRCISNCRYVETFCLEYVCSDCWKNPLQSPEMSEEIDMSQQDFPVVGEA